MGNILLAASSIAVLLIGTGIFWALYQVVQLLKEVRGTLLPEVQSTLKEVQQNLSRIETLTAEVDTTVSEANQIVASAGRTVKTVEDGVVAFQHKVVTPSLITLASAKEGMAVAWRAFRARRAQQPKKVVVIQEPKATAKPVEVLQP